MPLRLPALRKERLPPTTETLMEVLRATSEDLPSEAFIQVEREGGESFLFILKGRAHSAGALEDDRFVPLALDAFAGTLRGVTSAALHVVDLPLFLCAAVMFRKAPSAHVPLSLFDSEALLKNVQAMGKDAVLVVSRGTARNLVFCRGGAPTVLYPAFDEDFPLDGDIADRIMEYVYQGRAGPPVTLDLYDDIQLPPARGAGEPIGHYLERTTTSAPSRGSLIVRLGDRVVFRFPIIADETIIGRGDDTDVILDNLSVSRSHAAVTRSGDGIRVVDLKSENGVIVRGERKETALLAPGDEFTIGKYTLTFTGETIANEDVILPVAPRRARPPDDETVALSSARGASIEHAGRTHPMRGALFSIGAGEQASLRVRGLFIAENHIAIVKDSTGYKARHVGGLRKLKVNGAVTREARIHDGDVLSVGSEEFVFRLESTTGN
jgi:pSer/pThr/pTyr-binding forkhead associated (FHA) protein